METWDVFISHASEDKESIVEPLVQVLKENGISCWYDDNDIGWGDSLSDSINNGLKKSQYVLVVLSEAFITKGWAKAELNAMLSMEFSNGQKKVLPLIVGDEQTCINELPLLGDKKYIVWGVANLSTIVNEVKKVLKKQTKGDLRKVVDNTLSNIRQKLFTSHSVDELKKLFYKVEEYQSKYPHSVEAKVLQDSITKADRYARHKERKDRMIRGRREERSYRTKETMSKKVTAVSIIIWIIFILTIIFIFV